MLPGPKRASKAPPYAVPHLAAADGAHVVAVRGGVAHVRVPHEINVVHGHQQGPALGPLQPQLQEAVVPAEVCVRVGGDVGLGGGGGMG